MYFSVSDKENIPFSLLPAPQTTAKGLQLVKKNKGWVGFVFTEN
jgi:hypothetical protein